ncbi:Aminopeptidase 2 [Podosphaera aphanis]|nr:Aminopeptidase 2 [Podosphaera aphanis]
MAHIIENDRDILPDTFRPVNYAISLSNLEFGGNFNYMGTVTILSTINRSSKELTLNAHQLKILSAKASIKLADTRLSILSTEVVYDVPKQRATIYFAEELPVSEEAVIIIKFQGIINNDMAGFYRSKYKPATEPAATVPRDGDFHLMFSTQFESCDARRAFPCFDEPNLKATFDFEIEIPDDQVALSNMPQKAVKKLEDGLKLVSFETTPVMSTYLLAWAVGDFEYVEAFTKRKYNDKNLPVRIYTTRGLKNQGQFALQHAPQIVDYFSDIFGIDYPLPNMENWGLITYRTTALLFDEQVSDAQYKYRIAYVVAHELAHQWFGNLVTMNWWNELWLNEGFATWVGWLAVDHFHPDWHAWPRFVSEGMQTAFTLDSLRSSHPIEVPVKDALDVDQIFDSISYLKGSSVIRMLATHLGQETFLKGVRAYLKAHEYGNAKTTDLWLSLSDTSQQDILSMMDPWIRKIGFPVITVSENPDQINIRQSRYLSTGDVKIEEDKTTWWVPLGLEAQTSTHQKVSAVMTTKMDNIKNIDGDFYKINKNSSGFYRTNYPRSRLVTLSAQSARLSISDKIGLVGDAGALAVSGEASTIGLLDFVKGLQSEDNYFVWSQILRSLNTVKAAFEGNQNITQGLENFIVALISPAVERIGWEASPNDDILTSQLRNLLLLTAGLNGHKLIIAEALRLFNLFTSGQDKSAINQNLRSAVFGIALKKGGKSEYDALKQEWRISTSMDRSDIILRALGRTRVADLHTDFLSFLFSEVPTQDIHTGAMALSANPTARNTLWMYIQSHFDVIKEKLGKNMVVLDRFLRISLNNFNKREIEREIANFFAGKDNRGYDRTLAVVSDTILGRAAYQERDAACIVEWLNLNGYIEG